MKEAYEKGIIDPQYRSTKHMIGNILTKGLSGPDYSRLLSGLGINEEPLNPLVQPKNLN